MFRHLHTSCTRAPNETPTVVGPVPVLVPDGRAVGMGRSGHQSFLWDQTPPALVVVIHHEERVRAGSQSHNVHTLVHHTRRGGGGRRGEKTL